MSTSISSPYALFNNEAKPKLRLLKKIDVFMISSYKIEQYSRIIRLQNCIMNTLCKSNNKILNKNILEKINNEINLALPYQDYRYKAYHKKPEDILGKNKIYVYSHGNNDFEINEFVSDIIISESAKDRNSEKILACEKIDYQIIHNLNIDYISSNIKQLEKWQKIQSKSYEIQYKIDKINSLRNELDESLKSFDTSDGFIHTNFSVMECVKDTPQHNNRMRDWLEKQDSFLTEVKG